VSGTSFFLNDSEYVESEQILRDCDGSYVDALGRDRLLAYTATRGIKDLYFFATAIIGFGDFVPHLHEQMCRFSQQPRPRRKGYLIPRGHFKSSAITQTKPLWKAMADEDVRFGIFHEKATQAQQFLLKIKSDIETNPLLRALYPHRMPPNPMPKSWRWTQEAMLLPRVRTYPEPTFYAAGQGSALQGFHFTDMIWDDLIGEEAQGNPDVMQKVIDWMVRAESLSVTPETLHLDLIGTRWAYYDIYAWAGCDADETGSVAYTDMAWFKRAAIVNDEQGHPSPLFPERFSMESLLALKQKDVVSFSGQYMNQPTTGRTMEFSPAWLRYYRREVRNVDGMEQAVCALREYREEQDGSPSVPLSHMTILIQVDPGLGITEGRQKAIARHSRSAIIVVGLAWPRRIFVLHVWAEMEGATKLCEQILKFYVAYERQIKFVSIEKHSWTRMIRPTLLEEARKRNILLTDGKIHDFTKSSNVQKDVRVRSLQPFFAKGQMFLEEGMVELEREYRDFPMGKRRDIVDALSQGSSENLWRFPEDEEESPWDDNADNDSYEPSRLERGACASTGY
jgi:hypothetical protein